MRAVSSVLAQECGDSDSHSQRTKPEVKERRYKISPSQNARHSVVITSETPRSETTKLKTHKYGRFGDYTKNPNDKNHESLGSDKDVLHIRQIRPSLHTRAQTPISISDDDGSLNAEAPLEEATATAPPRAVTREEILAAAAKSSKRRITRCRRSPGVKTAYVDLAKEVTPNLDYSPPDQQRGGVKKNKPKRVYSRLKKRPYLVEDSGEAWQEEAIRGADVEVPWVSNAGKKFRFVNWRGEVMWLPVGTRVVVVRDARV